MILAAGIGSRFGGAKQLEPVGPGGETLLDYAVWDAERAGFTRVVFVIRHAMMKDFHPVASRYRDPLEVRVAIQHLEDAPKGINLRARTRPWGTGHALLAAAPHVSGRFAVCNADDFYGAEAHMAAATFLRESSPARVNWALVGYPLAATLSAAGPVNRAVCTVDEQGLLTGLDERRLSAGDAPPDSIVSMNYWCFTQEMFARLQSGFDAFAPTAGPDAEYLLPDVVRDALAEGAARVRVLRPAARWFGLTYPEDYGTVTDALRQLVAAGRYPSPLRR